MRKLMIAAAIAAATTTAPAVAQINTSNGLVNVTVSDVSVLNNFLNDTQIAALNEISVPIIVQVPIGVAANVCGVSAAVLGQNRGADSACTARSGSNALARAVTEQTLTQKYKKQ